MGMPISELERLAAITEDESLIRAAIADNKSRLVKVLNEK